MDEILAFKTPLNDRTLYGNGDTVADMAFLYNAIMRGMQVSRVCLEEPEASSEEVKVYNRFFSDDPLSGRNLDEEPSKEWNIPEEYKNLNLFNYLVDKLKEETAVRDFDDKELKLRYYRTKMELRLWEERNLSDMLRTLIFIVNTFEENNVVWGTGRGSSCASYILYLIGLHQVDSVEFELDIGEFFR
jgi:DNA polymerase III alpha subunit